MTNFKNLPQYNLILIRYNEIWLKSTKVKMRMLKILMQNIRNMLEKAEISYHKYQLSKDSTRIFFFFKNEDLPAAVEVLKKVFGIYTLSPALRTSNRMKNITERAVEIAHQVLKEGDSFAIRSKRSGTHDFTSQDVARKAGQAVLEGLNHLNLSVDLSSPDEKIFIEVRGQFSYVFTDIVESKWGGLPIEPRKKVFVMDVGRRTDLLAGFLLARRGCQIFPVLFDMTEKRDQNGI